MTISDLKTEKTRRQGDIKVINITRFRDLAARLSDQELERLVKIRQLTAKGDATRGSQAIGFYKRVAKLAPWDEICLMSIGVEYAQAGNFNEGIRWLKKAYALNPSNTRVPSNLEKVQAAARSRR